ncbi:MAG TPA: chromate resistance protein ChrB domain-containing protein [Acidimicrobiales bacterium]|nr:chromate resistance protein ChrB domain-containing protein [Acidimicrobiales bacterium]
MGTFADQVWGSSLIGGSAASRTGGAPSTPWTRSTHNHLADGAERCTLEVLLEASGLDRVPALHRLVRIVRTADIAREAGAGPGGAGLLATGLGGLAVEADDDRLLEQASFVYDALCAWCGRQTSAG